MTLCIVGSIAAGLPIYTHLQVTLDGVVDSWCGAVVHWHELVDSNVPDGILVICLLSVHHHTHTHLTGNLRPERGSNTEEM